MWFPDELEMRKNRIRKDRRDSWVSWGMVTRSQIQDWLRKGLERKIRKSNAKHRGHCIPMAYPGVCKTNKAERWVKNSKAPLPCSQQTASLPLPNSWVSYRCRDICRRETHIVTIHSHSTSMTETDSRSTSTTDTHTCSRDRKTKVQPFWKRIVNGLGKLRKQRL